jgi:hypothetical protein
MINPEKLFVLADTLSDDKVIGSIAINEENIPGLLIKVKNINNTKIYIGFDIAKGGEWVALNPMIMVPRMSVRTALELYYTLKEIKREEFKAKLDISVSGPLSAEQVISEMNGVTWNKFSFDENTPTEEIHEFFNKLFEGPMGNNAPPSAYNDNDFKIDNEDEDPDNM